MSDAKFTPGPWCVFSNSYTSGRITGQEIHHGINAYGDGPQGSVCQVSSGNPADGHLVAAAPELYEALQTVIGAYQCDEDLNLVMDQAKIAIEKARGEKQ